MKKTTCLLYLLIPYIIFAQQPKNSPINKNLNYTIDSTQKFFLISYTFKDQSSKYRTFSFSFNKEKTNKDISRYGIPSSFYNHISDSAGFSNICKKAIKKGFFLQSGKVLQPNRSNVVSYYRPYCKAIAGGIVFVLTEENKDSRLNRIEMAMKFVQGIPYSDNEIIDSTWEKYGIKTPPEILLNMNGSSDSKSILLVCILSYLINIHDILFLYQGNAHTLIAIKGNPTPDQKYIEINKIKYIIADVSGNARHEWGYDSNKFDDYVGYKIEKIKRKMFWFHSH